jgi:hypothetical protein
MKPFFLKLAALAAALLSALPGTALAQSSNCASSPPAAVGTSLNPDAAQMRCDLEQAATIRKRALAIYGALAPSMIEIIDTASPSGAAYMYQVTADGAKLRLDARSVPESRGPRCTLRATIPNDTAQTVSNLLVTAGDPLVPDYGAREDVTLNPDGSRTVRLILDSHDIITRADTANGARSFSRHAGSEDPVSQLNTLIIGIANVSPGWSCKAKF